MWPFKKTGASGFTSSSTAEEVTQGIDASGLTAIVTGASSGIGLETARVLAMRGAHVVMGNRNMSAGEKVKDEIIKEFPAAKINAMELDLSSLQSVRNFSSQFLSSGLPLNILINNADTMKKTARDTKREGRIVNVSSEAHRTNTYKQGIWFDKINDEKCYSRIRAYGQSKLANILHANELARRLQDEGANITANSLHPGLVTTNIFRQTVIIRGILKAIGLFTNKNLEQGASTTCYVALHPQLRGISGQYFVDNNLAIPDAKATDRDLAVKLWDFSMDLINKSVH